MKRFLVGLVAWCCMVGGPVVAETALYDQTIVLLASWEDAAGDPVTTGDVRFYVELPLYLTGLGSGLGGSEAAETFAYTPDLGSGRGLWVIQTDPTAIPRTGMAADFVTGTPFYRPIGPGQAGDRLLVTPLVVGVLTDASPETRVNAFLLGGMHATVLAHHEDEGFQEETLYLSHGEIHSTVRAPDVGEEGETVRLAFSAHTQSGWNLGLIDSPGGLFGGSGWQSPPTTYYAVTRYNGSQRQWFTAGGAWAAVPSYRTAALNTDSGAWEADLPILTGQAATGDGALTIEWTPTLGNAINSEVDASTYGAPPVLTPFFYTAPTTSPDPAISGGRILRPNHPPPAVHTLRVFAELPEGLTSLVTTIDTKVDQIQTDVTAIDAKIDVLTSSVNLVDGKIDSIVVTLAGMEGDLTLLAERATGTESFDWDEDPAGLIFRKFRRLSEDGSVEELTDANEIERYAVFLRDGSRASNTNLPTNPNPIATLRRIEAS